MNDVAKIKVGIVDNYNILREALRNVLTEAGVYTIVGESGDGHDAVNLVRKGCDLIILEPLIPKKDGIDLIKDMLEISNTVKILILSSDNTTHNAFRMLRSGAHGWLPKTTDTHALMGAIQTIMEGGLYLPQGLKEEFAKRYIHPDSVDQPEENLSDREYQVLRLLAQGHTNREIAEMLFIGVKTVDTHRANLLRKLNLRNNSDITRFAVRAGIIKL